MDVRHTSRRDPGVAGPIVFGAALVGLWQLLVDRGVVDRFYFSRPSAIAARVWEWLVGGSLYGHLVATLTEAFGGFAVGAVLGVGTGFVLGRTPGLARLC